MRAKVIESNGKLAWVQPVPVGAVRAEMTPIVVVAAVIERDDAFLLTLRPDGTHLRATGSFPAARSTTARRTSKRCAGRSSKSSTRSPSVGELVHTVTHAYPEKTVELFFYRCDFDGRAEADDGAGDALGAARRAGVAAVSRSRSR